jgi:hypothetical protein
MTNGRTLLGISVFAVCVLSGCGDEESSGGFIPAENVPPVVTITGPQNGYVTTETVTISFTATAADQEDGLIPGTSIRWESNKDGEFGIGSEVLWSGLSVGSHAVTARATDSHGDSGSSTISVNIQARPAQPPSAEIVTPQPGETFAVGEEVPFLASVDDPDGPELPESAIVWSSDIDGQIGTGRSFGTTALTAGAHVITLTVTDPQSLTGTATVLISITP